MFAGRKAAAIGGDHQIVHAPRRFWTQVFGEQVEVQRQDITGLAVPVYFASGFDIGGGEGGADVISQCGIGCRVGCFADHVSDGSRRPDCVKVHGGGEYFRRNGAATWITIDLALATIKPVGKTAVDHVEPEMVGIGAVDQGNIFPQRGVMLAQQPGIGIIQVQPPGQQHPGIGPAWSARFGFEAGSEILESTPLRLGISQILYPFAIEGGHVHVEYRRLGINRSIVGPAHALGTLRAIRGHAHIIAALAPQGAVPDGVQQRIEQEKVPVMGESEKNTRPTSPMSEVSRIPVTST